MNTPQNRSLFPCDAPHHSPVVISFTQTTDAAEQDTSQNEAVFRAGAAVSNITLPLGSLIVAGWLSMWATNIHAPLWVRCLVLDGGEPKLAFVIRDNLVQKDAAARISDRLAEMLEELK